MSETEEISYDEKKVCEAVKFLAELVDDENLEQDFADSISQTWTKFDLDDDEFEEFERRAKHLYM